MPRSIVFVHGTGVRFGSYGPSLAVAREQAAAASIAATIEPCSWGEPLGISFEGRSVPGEPESAILEKEAQELAQWTWLLDDPLAEMERLAIRTPQKSLPPFPGVEPAWRRRLDAIRGYRASAELRALLNRTGAATFWHDAFNMIVQAPMVEIAFKHSEEAGELPDAIQALTRAVAAELHNLARAADQPGLSANLRERLCTLLKEDWKGSVAGLGTFLTAMFKRAGTSMLRRRRTMLNAAIAAPIGDILLYQSHGVAIRDFIRDKVEQVRGPVTLVAHSLGGIACVDLLALPDAPKVHGLVTIGSQAPFFHELGALTSLKECGSLPEDFPPWLNIYDRNDFLSFLGDPVFPGRVRDFEVRSGQPFPDSHSAYVGNPAVWAEIAGFVAE